jgi:hypothetical protein
LSFVRFQAGLRRAADSEPVETAAFAREALPSGVFRDTVFLPVRVPVPLRYVILFFLKRDSTPLEF